MSIEVSKNGPYAVHGLPLVRARMVGGEPGKPVEWEVHEEVDTAGEADADGTYWLCRCGHSSNKPFCDGSHKRVGFDGTEAAPATTYRQRAKVLGGSGVEVHDDRSICQHAGFCARRDTNVWTMVPATEDETVRSEMVEMIDHCPSGALTHHPRPGAEADEPDLEQRVAVVDDGALWVTGGVAITRSDGTMLEQRNRVTLCRCGASESKPLCDGTHAKVGFSDS